jgi:uncharacterized membrane protein YeaQ/YmgE (transglycosylase-associated protein family)
MAGNSIAAALIIGLIAGWLASLVVGGGGILHYLIIGVIGSFVGSFLVNYFRIYVGIASPFWRDVVISTFGAIVLVVIARLIG